MTRLKYLILTILAVSAVGAAASASASAEACPESGKPALCFLNGSLLETAAKGKYAFTDKNVAGSEAVLLVASVPVKIDCTTVTSKGEFVQGTPLTEALTVKNVELLFTNCTILEQTGCTVTVPIVVKAEGAILEADASGELEKVEFKEVGTAGFTTITISGTSCNANIVGNNKVKGSTECQLVTPATDLTAHLLLCLEGEDNLTFAGKAAEFEMEDEVEALLLENSTAAPAWSIELA